MNDAPHRRCCASCLTVAPQAEMIRVMVPPAHELVELTTLWFCGYACLTMWLDQDHT